MSDSSDEAPIGFKGKPLTKLAGIKVSKAKAFGSAVAPSRPPIAAPPTIASRNTSLLPIVQRKTSSVRFAPIIKPAVAAAPLSAVVEVSEPSLGAVVEEAPVIELGEVGVASADEVAAAKVEVSAIQEAIIGKKKRFASNPPPADAPIMAEGELTEDMQDRIEGENPVRTTPLTLASGEVIPENEYTLDVKRESGAPVGIGEYRPISSSRFSDFIIETYGQFSPYLQRVLKEGKEAAAVPKELDRDACKKRDPNKVETFYYQNFVRDYLSRGSPYRGLLVYHGLGTGKTCTSIAAAEALYWGGQKTIFVMTPATLSNNYRKDLGKCGYFPLRRNNFWAFLKAGSAEDPAYVWLTEALGLPPATVTAQGGGWVANPDKTSNWETLSPEVVSSIRSQQTAHLNHRFKFIHYNGVTPTVLAQLAAGGVAAGKSMFDDAVVVIDEIHNLVRTINGSMIGGKPISQIIEKVEPREYTWSTPLGRERPGFRYPRGYTLYRLLQNAVGAKIIALSATPMINYAQELAVLMNLIGGEQRVVEISLKSMGRDPATMKRLEEWASLRPDIDFFAIEENASRSPILTVTPVPFGFVKVVRTLNYDAARKKKPILSAAETAELKLEDFENRGFVRVPPEQAISVQESRERNMDKWAVTLLKDLESKGLLRGGGVEAETAVTEARAKGPGSVPLTPLFTLHTFPMLPEDATQFVTNFVDRNTLRIMNVNVLKARAAGLISYYRGGSEELMPRKGRNEKVNVPMSEYMFKQYSIARLAELDMESPPEQDEETQQKKRKGMTAAEVDMYAQATKSQQTGFLALSRAACNWVFPEEVPRPKVSAKDQVKLLGAEQNRLVDADLEEPQDADMDSAAAPALVGADEEVGVAAVLPDAPPEAPTPLDATLTGILGTLMSGIEGTPEKAEAYLNAGLPTFSPKYATMIANIRTSPGPALVYSQFKTLEGLGIFAAALRASPEKYLPLDIQKVGGEWIIPEALLTAEAKARPRYILYTGDQELDKRRLLLQLYNADLSSLPPRLATQCADLLAGAPDNRDGRVCRVFMITQSGAEGISLFNTRQVHIMEPYWNNVRLQQVIGRAIRLCSHQDLPWDDRVVDIFTYVSVFSAEQKATGSKKIMVADKSMTTDEIIFDIATKKQILADGLFEIAQTSAVDCDIHYHEHGQVTQCFKYEEGSHPLFMYHPDWRKDLKAPVRPVQVAAK